MEPITIRVEKTTPGYGYMNRILRVDLSAGDAHSQDSSKYLPHFLGGRGLAAKIAWDEYPEPVAPFDPANPLMIFPGALTGTRSPYNGRTSVCSFSPQALPYNWFTRSNIGGWIGGNIKRAGYDGIVVTGKADQPARIRIIDDEVQILPADELWGVDALDTLEELVRLEGKTSRSLVIGPAGEHLSRIATIQTGTSSACGQGGFGAVMGSKNLKAITVSGTYTVKAAKPDAIRHLARQVAKAAITPPWLPGMLGKEPKELNEEMAREGEGKVRYRGCTEGCLTPCYPEFRDMPGRVHQRTYSGAWPCVAGGFLGRNRPGAKNGIDRCPDETVKNGWGYSLDRRAGFEMNVLSNRYGLNQFEILMGMVPWLNNCQKAGLIDELNGVAMDWSSPEFWDTFLHAVAYREGAGDALAEGTARAAEILDLGQDLLQRFYPGWGQAGHWDGHMSSSFPFPYWISAAVQWLADTRDPYNAGHGSKRFIGIFNQAVSAKSDDERDSIITALRNWSKGIYGTEAGADPYSGYEAKGRVAHFHTIRPILKDCVPVDDITFPLFIDLSAPDYQVRLSDIDGNTVKGTEIEYNLYRFGTGVEWSGEEFEQAAARVYTLERALQVRHWRRDRSLDETVLPFFDRLESFQNPLLKERLGLDREQFKPVLDEFYTLHGWDPATGWPTEGTLESLGLTGVYEPMIAGAIKD